ncbi:MAG: restriction endonuclease [Luteibacter sp.]|jgi:hypothetical protein
MFSARQTSAGEPDALARLSWQDFEHLLAEHYREQGYRVEHHAPVTTLKELGGGGLDLRLTRGSENVVVQCRHWDTVEVPVQEVNELLSVMLNEAASRGVLVTRGRFSSEAMGVARRQPRLQLVDGDVLRVLLKLPEHLDTSIPGTRPAKAVKQKKARSERRHGVGDGSRLVPALIVVVVAVLLGLFAWRAMTRRDALADDTPPPAATVAPPPVVQPIPDLPPAPPPTQELSGASGIVSKGRSSLDPPPPTHELEERERLRQQSERDRASQHKGEDAMKVMERNTRELGSHE